MNLVVLIGRLTADPELKSTSSGISYCRFSVAVDRFTKQGDDKKTDFINCVAWDQQAEFISRYFAKGVRIALQGRIETGSYTNRDGQKVYTTDIRVDRVEFADGKRDQGSGSSYTGSRGSEQRTNQETGSSYSNGSAGDFASQPLDDDLPF